MSTKKITPAVQKARLLALAGLLESLPEKLFSYDNFCQIASEYGNDAQIEAFAALPYGTDLLAIKTATECGTTACAVGWAPSLPAAKKLGFGLTKTRGGGVVFTKNGRYCGIHRFASQFFGLSGEAFSFLFYPTTLLGGLRSPDSDASASDVAEHIRDFVAIRFA